MKKSLLIAAALLISAAATAQHLSAGLKAGANYANWSKLEHTVEQGNLSNQSARTDAVAGFQVGAFLNFGLTPLLGIQSEAVFSQQGYKFNGDADTPTSSTTLSYVNVPLLLEYKPLPKLGILVGPQAGFLVSAKSKIDGTKEDQKQFVNALDWSAVIGLQVHLTKSIDLGARYNLGLNKAMKNTENSIFKGGKNSVAVLAIGFNLL